MGEATPNWRCRAHTAPPPLLTPALLAPTHLPLQVKLLDKLMHGMADAPGQQVVLLSQVLAAEANIGYEEMANTQVGAGGSMALGDCESMFLCA